MCAAVEREVRLVGEVEVVPRDLVAEDRRALERAQALGGDRLVVLVDVVQRRLEDEVGLPVVPDLDQQLEDLLAVVGERAHVEVVHGQVRVRDAELGGRLAHLAGQRVGREALRERPRGDRERDVADLRALLDEARHRPAAAELAVVGVRRQHEDALAREHHRAPFLSGPASRERVSVARAMAERSGRSRRVRRAARPRSAEPLRPTLGGLALIAAAEVLFASSAPPVRVAGGARRSSGSPCSRVAAAVLVRLPALVLPVFLLAAPFRLPLDFGSEHPLYVAIARGGETGRLLPLYFVVTARGARARVAARCAARRRACCRGRSPRRSRR